MAESLPKSFRQPVTPGDEPVAPASGHARVAVVLSHPIQYYSPWFRRLAAQGWPIRVFYLWDFGVQPRHDPGFNRTVTWDVDLLSGYESEFVPNQSRSPGTDHLRGLNNPTLSSGLAAWRPDVVLMFGYKYVTQLRLLLWPRWPLVFRGDSHLIDHPPTRVIKRLALSLIFRRFAAVTYVGQANRDYFRTFGVSDARLFFAPHAVDPDLYSRNRDTEQAANALRRELGLERFRIVLFAGKMVAAKQPLALLRAFIETARTDWALVFVGDGSEREALQLLAREHPQCAIRFLPFANQSEMPARYLLADIFTLPSAGLSETWGLAVQEAMHLGVPCLVSHRVGCQRDLVTEGETGWVFQADSASDLRRGLNRAMEDCRTDRRRFSTAAQARVAAYSYDAATAGLQAAVAAALKTRHSHSYA